MHIHAAYSINLAEMGSNRDEIHEIAARRAAEVRRRLAALASAAAAEDQEVAFVKTVSEADSDPPPNPYSTADGEQVPVGTTETEVIADRDHGSLFSARA